MPAPESRPRTVTVFRETDAILGESLVWDQPNGDILWCDITAGLIHRSPIAGATDGADDTVIALPSPVASFSLADVDLGPEVTFVVSLGDRIVLADAAGVVVRELAAIHHAHPGLRLNEGKVDPVGRWVTGSMELTHPDDPDAAFYSITTDGPLRTLVGGLGVANGLEWSADGTRIWFTDTSTSTIYTADYTSDGGIENVRPWQTGAPHDGLVRATDDTFWGAHYGAGVVVHYAPDTTELERVELPAPNLTSVALTADGMLYVCSARENLTQEQLEAHPLSGSVFAVTTDSVGVPARRFGSA